MTPGVDKIRDSYSSDAEYAKRSTRTKFSFIVSNMDLLETVDSRGSHEKFLDDITDDMEHDRTLPDWQVDKIENIYELVMKAADLPYVPVHQDRRRRGINYGHQGK